MCKNVRKFAINRYSQLKSSLGYAEIQSVYVPVWWHGWFERHSHWSPECGSAFQWSLGQFCGDYGHICKQPWIYNIVNVCANSTYVCCQWQIHAIQLLKNNVRNNEGTGVQNPHCLVIIITHSMLHAEPHLYGTMDRQTDRLMDGQNQQSIPPLMLCGEG